MTTIRALLAAFHGAERIHDPDRLIDTPVVEAHFCSSENPEGRGDCIGLLQLTCGGDAIMSFVPNKHLRWRVYLIVDDRAHDGWLASSRMLAPGLNPVALLGGCCPHRRLTLVASA